MSPPTELASNGGDNVVDIGVVGTGGAPAPDRRQHPGPGYWLRQARERRGWSQREAADMLNLSARFLVAMEDETFDKLPAPAFARGYLRAYAKLLNLSGDEIIRRYESVVGDDSDPYFKDLSSARRQPMLDFVRAHPGFIMSTLGVLALLVLLGALWWGWGLVRQQGPVLEPALDALGGAATGVAVDEAPAVAAQDERNTLALPPAAAGSDLVPVEVEQDAVALPPAPVAGAPAAVPTDAQAVAAAVPPPVGCRELLGRRAGRDGCQGLQQQRAARHAGVAHRRGTLHRGARQRAGRADVGEWQGGGRRVEHPRQGGAARRRPLTRVLAPPRWRRSAGTGSGRSRLRRRPAAMAANGRRVGSDVLQVLDQATALEADLRRQGAGGR